MFEEGTEEVINSEINYFIQSMLNSKIVLSSNDANSSITYTIQLHNNSNYQYIFDGTKYIDEFYDNDGIVFTLNGLEVGDVIEANGNLTFTITFSYKDNIIADNNTLNSYLNFQFIDISAENCNVEVAESIIDVYNAEIDTLSAKITNNNKYEIEGNITFNGEVLDTFIISSKESQTKTNLSIEDKISSLSAKDGYDLKVNIISPCSKEIANIKVNVKGTITNIEKYGVTVKGNSTDPYLIYAIEDLVRFAQNVNSGTNYSGEYVKQLRNLDFSSTGSYYNYSDTTIVNGSEIRTAMTTGTGFMGIGNSETNTFNGTYLGNNKSISNLYINNTTEGSRIGLFGYVNATTIQDLGIESGNINCKGDSGTLVAYLDGVCNITNCYSKANITNSTAGYSVGGIIGSAHIGSTVTIKQCYNTGNITNVSATAGIVGFVWGANTTVILEECYNSGVIKSTSSSTANVAVAGLVVKDSNVAGKVVITRCYNSGNVTGIRWAGGLVSAINGVLQITDSYNIGTITSTLTTTGINATAGGIVAYKYGTAQITMTNVYSAGTVSATSYKGGIVGYNVGGGTSGVTCTRTYFLNTNSATSTYGGTAETEANMKLESFVTTLNNGGSNWKYNSGGYPQLSWQ